MEASHQKNRNIRWISSSVLIVLLLVSAFFSYRAVFLRAQRPAAQPADDVSPSAPVQELPTVSPSEQPVASEPEPEPDPVPTQPAEERVNLRFVKVKEAVNLRETEKEGAKVLTTLTKGEELEYVSENTSKYQVKWKDGKTGWLVKNCGELLEKEVVIRHLPAFTGGAPIDMKGTQEGDGIGAILKHYGTVGASVAVIKDGQVCYHYEYGYADKENKVKVAENTKFRIASVTKVFTTMMAMKQVDDGILDLDEDLSKILGYKVRHPSFPKKPLTTRMLLTHTSGLADRPQMYGPTLRTKLSDPNHYSSEPGKSFLYSNLGMGTAGAVLEKSADQIISEYARDKFFQPMELDASFDAKYLSDKSLVANCYEGSTLKCDNKYLTRAQAKGGPGATYHLTAGGLLISAEDLASLYSILVNDGQYNGQQYLSHEAVEQIFTVQRSTKQGFDQCLGIRKGEKLGGVRDMYYHTGDAYGIYSLMAIDPADKSGVIIITSGARGSKNASNTLFSVCEDVLKDCYTEIITG